MSKVFTPPKAPTNDTMYVQGDGWLDVARSKSLWKEVYRAPEAFVKTGDWIDAPSIGIPYLYIFSGAELAQALRAGGDTRGANEVQARAKAIAKTVRVDSQFNLFQPSAADEQRLAPSNDAPRSVPLHVTPAAPPAGGEPRRQR